MEADRGREVASIDWSFASVSQQPYLPPKSPVFAGGPSTLPDSSNSFFSNWSGFPHQGGGRRQHHRTPSTSFLPQTPAWIDDLLNDTPDAPPVRSLHRRSSSDSVAFLEVPFQHARIDDIAEEEELDFGNASLKSGRGFKHSDNFEEEQLTSKFAGIGPFQKHRSTYSVAKPDALLSDRRTPSENPSTTSDQESSKAYSLDDQRIRGVGYLKSEAEVQSAHKGEQTLSSTGNTEPLPTSNLNDPSLDPKRAKRILANRQSAQRSRVRKLQYISELERSVNILQEEVSTLSPQVAYLDHHRIILNVDNSAMKQRLAALAQEKLFKDAQNEALKKEVNRLRQVFQQQQQRQMQQNNQQQLATNLSSHQEMQAKEPGISSDVVKCMDGGLKDNGTDVLEVHGPSGSPLLKPIGPSSCLTGEKGRGLLDSQIVSTSTAVHSDLRVHNP